MIRKSVKVHERSKTNRFHSKRFPPQLTPPVPPSSFVSSPAVLWAGVEMLNMKKKKMKKFKKKKKTKTFLTFCSTSLPLYSPLSGSSSKSNLAHVSILTPFPSFYLSASPLICLFLFILHPFLFPLWFSSSLTSAPFPHYTSCFRLSSISLLTSLPSVPPSISCNMKGYLCADSQGRRRAES